MAEEINPLKNFTPRARQVLMLAQREAQRLNHDYLGTEHLLLGLLALNEGIAVEILRQMQISLADLRLEVEKVCGSGGQTHKAGALPVTQRLKRILLLSGAEARSMNYNFVGTEHLLLALLRDGDSKAAHVLANLKVDANLVREAAIRMLDSNYVPENDVNNDSEEVDNPDAAIPPSSPGGSSSSGNESGFSALNSFGRNLTRMAADGELDPVIGRQHEIERVIQILCRRTKNNPVLIGEAGVGKTAILEGLAQAIVKKNVPEILLDKKIYALDLPLMVAGTKYRGQFEERIKAVIDEVRNSKQVILFIDEIHTIVGAGAGEGSMDAANIIKPALSRGELQCVGATTLDEYRKNIEKDAALERRFQSVIVNPPNLEDAEQILLGLRSTYEDHHHVRYTDAAIAAAVKLSDRYISGRFLPDKAIDIMDEAGARARIANTPSPLDTMLIDAEISEAQKHKEEAIVNQQYEEAARWRDRERELHTQKEEMLEVHDQCTNENWPVIDAPDMALIVAKLTGVPVQQMEAGENERLLQMESMLNAQIIGQEQAVGIISRALRRSRADLKNPNRPIGSFIFLGPTGVGKTLLAKQLAEFMFGDSDAIIQIDMSEYMEKFNVSRLVGSPPGYVGYGEGGELTERVRRRPYSVVLFDEIEKAHPDVMHLLLQILEEGRITDTLGRRVDFRNTIIIMTSNVGADRLAHGGALGFGSDADNSIQSSEKLLDTAKKFFKPEFINRVDDIIVFRKLNREDLIKIIDLELSELSGRLATKELKLIIANEVKNFIITKGFEPEYGARPLRRAVERYIEDPLAEELLRGHFNAPGNIQATLTADNQIIFAPEIIEPVKRKRTPRKKKEE